MRRREFIELVGGAVASAICPCVARAQQPALPLVGFLNGGSPEAFAPFFDAFSKGLSKTGFVDGRNVKIEDHWAEGHYNRMPDIAAELVRRQVAVIAVGGGGAPSVILAKLTTAIPIVFGTGADPVEQGLVTSLSRPGGNVTGVYFFTAAMDAKRLGLLHELVPQAATIAVLVNPAYPNVEFQEKEVQEGARILGLQIQILRASTEADIETAFAAMVQQRPGGLLVCSDPFFNSRRKIIVALAARDAIPAVYEQREFADDGGLMTYGTSIRSAYHQIGIYTGRILKGEKPADLPVMQSTRFEFVINLKTAKLLGLEVPPGLSARADEVIE